MYIKCLSICAPAVADHIKCIHSKEMATKSEIAVLDVNEAKNDDVCKMAAYLGPEYQWTVLCGGDQ